MAVGKSIIPVICLLVFTNFNVFSEAEEGFEEGKVEILPGNLYRYNYATTLHLQTLSLDNKMGTIHYKIHGEVTVQSVDITDRSDTTNKVLKLTLSNLSVINLLSKDASNAKFVGKSFSPFYIERSDEGTIDRIHVDISLNPDWINFIKGIANLFNYHVVEWDGREIDASGDCQTKYEIQGQFLVKRKSHCLNTDLSVERDAWHELLSVEKEDSIVSKYNFNEDQQLVSISASEYHKVQAIIDPNIGSLIRSSQFLTLSDVSKIKDEQSTFVTMHQLLNHQTGAAYKEVFLSTSIKAQPIRSADNIYSSLKKEMDNLSDDKLSTINSSRSFVKLISSIREFYNKDDLNRIINEPMFTDIKLQLLDILAACQTGVCFSALMDQLQFDDSENEDIQERILFSMSYMTMPNEQSVKEFFDKVTSTNFKIDNVKFQAIYTLGTLAGKLGQSKVGKYSEVIKKIAEYFSNSLKDCKSEDCHIMYLGAIKNSKFADLTPMLLNHVKLNSTTRIKVMTIKALSSVQIPDSYKESVTKTLFDLFYRPTSKVDNSVKLHAFDLLFQLDTKVQELVKLCRHERNNTNLVKPLIKRLTTWESMQLISGATPLLNNDPLLNNYHVYSFRTLSNYEHGFLSESVAHAIDFELSMLSGPSGIVKESGLDVTLVGSSSAIQFLSVNLFANGIDSLVGDSEQSDEDASAGMVISILGKSLRPVTFFTGQSGLMTAVWNAPSAPVSALQGLLLVLDFQSTIHLQNGLVLPTSIEGGLSFDLSGSIEISLWNRNSDSMVRNAGALFVRSDVMMYNDLLNLSFTNDIMSETHIDFETKINFAVTPFQMCLEMKLPDVQIRKFIQSKHFIPSDSEPVEENYRSRIQIPGTSYAFGTMNNRMCRIIHDAET